MTCVFIMGNPPYSSGQKSENDNNKNIKYTTLDKKIKDTYVKLSTAKLKNSLYDSYKRAIRFATDRLIEQGEGIVSFVTNGSFLDANADDGLRKTLVKEYSSIYIFNLRGNQRTSGETSRKEGGKIFGGGSRAPICISLFVMRKVVMQKIDRKNKQDAKIYYHDIGDYLKREEKLKIIKEYKSFINLPLQEITPNKQGDWLNQRNNEEYETYQTLGNKDKTFTGAKMFLNYTMGIATSRDAWVYHFSKEELINNVKNTIEFYNSEVDRLIDYSQDSTSKKINIDDFVNNDSTKISWSGDLKSLLSKKQKLSFNESNIRESLYRPFCKQYLYYAKELNERHYQIPKLMPQANLPNIFIGVVGKGAKK